MMSVSIFAIMVVEKWAKDEGSRAFGEGVVCGTCQFHLHFNVQEVQSVRFFYFIVFLTLISFWFFLCVFQGVFGRKGLQDMVSFWKTAHFLYERLVIY